MDPTDTHTHIHTDTHTHTHTYIHICTETHLICGILVGFIALHTKKFVYPKRYAYAPSLELDSRNVSLSELAKLTRGRGPLDN